eukprot:1612461-Rhodomonas_salina.1
MATLVLVLPGYQGKTAVSPGPEPMLPNMPFNDFDCTAIAIRRTHYRVGILLYAIMMILTDLRRTMTWRRGRQSQGQRGQICPGPRPPCP